MHVIGILGGVASGKSLVAQRLQELGATVLDADVVGHQVLRDDEVKRHIARRFGEGVFDAAGEVNRGALARIVFVEGDEGVEALADLESIVHPLISSRLREEIERLAAAGVEVIVLDAPVMLKAGWDKFCDTIIFVDTPRDVRIARASSRGWSAEELDAREARQTPIEVKRAAASIIIENSRTPAETYDQVDRFWASLQ